MDANAVNPALTAIRNDPGGAISAALWTIDAYNVTFAVVLLTSGAFGPGYASGVVNRARQVGITVGTAVLGHAFGVIGDAAGVHTTMMIGGAVQLIGAG